MTSPLSKRFSYLGFYAFLSLGINSSVVGPALPTFAAHTGAPIEQVGLLFTPFALGYATSVFIMGPIGTRSGTRAMLLSGAVCLIASFLLLLLGRSLATLFLGTYLLGLGQSGTQVGYNATIGRLAGQDAARVLNRLNSSFGIGALIGPLLIALGHSQFGSADIGLILALVLCLPLFVGALAWRQPAGRGSEEGATTTTPSTSTATATATATATSTKAILRQPVLWILGVTASVYVSSEVTFSGWVAAFTERSAGVSVAQSALAVTAFFAGFAVGRAIASAVAKFAKPATIMSASIALAAAGIGLMIVAGQQFSACIAGSFLVGCAMAPMYPTLISYGIRMFLHQATLVTGYLVSMASIVTLFVPSAVGVLMANQGTTAAWSALLLTVALLGALWLVLRRFVVALE